MKSSRKDDVVRENTSFRTDESARDAAPRRGIEEGSPLTVGCVIMASGLGTRFRRGLKDCPSDIPHNKLLATLGGRPLISYILELTEGDLFAGRVAVTRDGAVSAYCLERGVRTLLHTLPARSDTIRLGLEDLAARIAPDGCMFCPADQPLLRRESLDALVASFRRSPSRIHRLAYQEGAALLPGSPVLFPKRLFAELLRLPEGAGGSFLIQKYPEQVTYVPVRDPYELYDVDTPEALSYLTPLLSSYPSGEGYSAR